MLTTVGAAILAHIEAQRYDFLVTTYRAAERRLTDTLAAFTPALKEHLAKKGFDPLMGARPMARLIQDTIRRALADELLFGKLQHGGKVTIDIAEAEKIVLKFEEEPAAAVT